MWTRPVESPAPRRGARVIAIAVTLLVVAAVAAAAHDLFLVPERFVVPERGEAVLRLLNGTFDRSENAVARGRIRDASIAGPRGRLPIDLNAMAEQGDTSVLRVTVGTTGTYAIGVSTAPAVLALTGEEFNEYLREDGLPDVLADRRARNELERPVRERYHKHVKAIVQVGDSLSGHYGRVFGYPAEVVPLDNPYGLKAGATLRVRVRTATGTIANQFIMYGGRTPSGAPIGPRTVRSAADGTARIPITGAGTWYVKFIHMTRLAADTVDYESRWASLTFQVR